MKQRIDAALRNTGHVYCSARGVIVIDVHTVGLFAKACHVCKGYQEIGGMVRVRPGFGDGALDDVPVCVSIRSELRKTRNDTSEGVSGHGVM